MNEIKVRLPVSRETAFVLENPEAAKFAASELKPEALLVILFELGTVADLITRIFKDIAASNKMEASNGLQGLTKPDGTASVG